MVLEGLKTEDRPLAVGYFILDTQRTFYQTGVRTDSHITITVNLVTPAELEEISKHIAVFLPPNPVDDLGTLYKLLVAVSRGDDQSF